MTNDIMLSTWSLFCILVFMKYPCQEDMSGIFIIEPFFRFWDIEDSDVNFGIYEPANETTEYGIQLVWMF